MNNKKPILVCRNGRRVKVVNGTKEAAELCGLQISIVARLLTTGRATRSGYTFDRPIEFDDEDDKNENS